jgi:arsenate reductase (glutaredoxin)
MDNSSTAANSVSASDRGPRQATAIATLTARNNAVNSIFDPDARKPVVLYSEPSNRAIPESIEMTITIYGIKNCDTMKKARAWLDGHGVAYNFHDYKTEGVAKDKLKTWSDELGWEALLNRAGTTFRKLPDGDKEGLNERKAVALMMAQPSMIKRPLLDLGGKLLVGFKPEIYAKEVTPSGKRAKT